MKIAFCFLVVTIVGCGADPGNSSAPKSATVPAPNSPQSESTMTLARSSCTATWVNDHSALEPGQAIAPAAEMVLAASEPAELEPAIRFDPATKAFLEGRLAELDAFKTSQTFANLGFGTGGPHYVWLESIQIERKKYKGKGSIENPCFEAGALTALLTLGMEYMRTSGMDNELTRFMRADIHAHLRREFHRSSN